MQVCNRARLLTVKGVKPGKGREMHERLCFASQEYSFPTDCLLCWEHHASLIIISSYLLCYLLNSKFRSACALISGVISRALLSSPLLSRKAQPKPFICRTATCTAFHPAAACNGGTKAMVMHVTISESSPHYCRASNHQSPYLPQ